MNTQMNVQHCLIWELILYEFKLGQNAVEASKNIHCTKNEGEVDYSEVDHCGDKVDESKNEVDHIEGKDDHCEVDHSGGKVDHSKGEVDRSEVDRSEVDHGEVGHGVGEVENSEGEVDQSEVDQSDVDHSTVNRLLKKFYSSFKNLDNQARLDNHKTVDSKVILQAIDINLEISIGRVPGKFIISVVHHPS